MKSINSLQTMVVAEKPTKGKRLPAGCMEGMELMNTSEEIEFRGLSFIYMEL